MDRLGLRGVVLAVSDTRAGAHPLHVARPDDGAGPDRVPVLEATLEHVRDDLHVAMRMGSKPLPRLYAVFVDDAQRAKVRVFGIVVVGEGKSMTRVQPAVDGMAALFCRSNGHHGCLCCLPRVSSRCLPP